MYRNETALVRAMVARIKAEWPDAWTFKVHGGPMQAAGVPDILACVEGRFFAFEAKHQKPGESEEHARGRATPLQLHVIELLRKAGATACVALTPEEVAGEIRLVVAR